MTINNLIDNAIKNRWVLVIRYRKYNGEVSVRKISDIHYSGEFGDKYIDAYCHKRQERRTFKIDRILTVRKCEENARLKSKKNPEGCYIATMAYGDYNHPQVIKLRQYRDNRLKSTVYGRCFIILYYTISPWLVKVLGNNQRVNTFIRKELDTLIVKLHL